LLREASALCHQQNEHRQERPKNPRPSMAELNANTSVHNPVMRKKRFHVASRVRFTF
jgi:hypothetical protein